MFQYAFAYSYSVRNSIETKYFFFDYNSHRELLIEDFQIKLRKAKPIEILKSKFNLPFLGTDINSFLSKRSEFLKEILIKQIIIENDLTFSERYLLPNQTAKFYEGYWQSYKYFKNIQDELRKHFKLKLIWPETYVIASDINKHVAISIHVRRGDYLKKMGFHKLQEIKYYQKAIDYINSKIYSSCKFYFFSDDLDWVEKNFKNLENKYLIKFEKDLSESQEIHLMSLCNHNIISNSTFSWWGAWLNTHTDKMIIGPKEWYITNNKLDDLIPPEWKLI